MFNNDTKQTDAMSDRLPALLVSGLAVGAGMRGHRFGYVIATIVVFVVGVLVGWLIRS